MMNRKPDQHVSVLAEKMMKPQVQISIATPIDTTNWDFGRSVLTEICRTDGRLVPQYFGSDDPPKSTFVDIEACEQLWAPEVTIDGPLGRVSAHWNCAWRRTKAIRYRGNIYHTSGIEQNRIQPGWLKFQADPDTKVDWLDLFKRLCVAASPSFALLHLFTDAECEAGAFGESEEERIGANDFCTGPSGAVLQKRCIPNLGWATFFGQPYTHEVDRGVLQSRYRVECMASGDLLVLTDDIFDVGRDFSKFSEKRNTAKSYFKEGFFQLSKEPLHGQL